MTRERNTVSGKKQESPLPLEIWGTNLYSFNTIISKTMAYIFVLF